MVEGQSEEEAEYVKLAVVPSASVSPWSSTAGARRRVVPECQRIYEGKQAILLVTKPAVVVGMESNDRHIQREYRCMLLISVKIGSTRTMFKMKYYSDDIVESHSQLV